MTDVRKGYLPNQFFQPDNKCWTKGKTFVKTKKGCKKRTNAMPHMDVFLHIQTNNFYKSKVMRRRTIKNPYSVNNDSVENENRIAGYSFVRDDPHRQSDVNGNVSQQSNATENGNGQQQSNATGNGNIPQQSNANENGNGPQQSNANENGNGTQQSNSNANGTGNGNNDIPQQLDGISNAPRLDDDPNHDNTCTDSDLKQIDDRIDRLEQPIENNQNVQDPGVQSLVSQSNVPGSMFVSIRLLYLLCRTSITSIIGVNR